MTLPKFIITMDGYFRLGQVNQHGVIPPVVPRHEKVGHVAYHQEHHHQQQESARYPPEIRKFHAPLAASHHYHEQPHYAEADKQHPVDINQYAGVFQHRHVVHPAVLAVRAQHGVRRLHVIVVSCLRLLLLCHLFLSLLLQPLFSTALPHAG